MIPFVRIVPESGACLYYVQGELEGRMEGMPTLFVYDIQLTSSIQRKGLGKHMMQVSQFCLRDV